MHKQQKKKKRFHNQDLLYDNPGDNRFNYFHSAKAALEYFSNTGILSNVVVF